MGGLVCFLHANFIGNKVEELALPSINKAVQKLLDSLVLLLNAFQYSSDRAFVCYQFCEIAAYLIGKSCLKQIDAENLFTVHKRLNRLASRCSVSANLDIGDVFSHIVQKRVGA